MAAATDLVFWPHVLQHPVRVLSFPTEFEGKMPLRFAAPEHSMFEHYWLRYTGHLENHLINVGDFLLVNVCKARKSNSSDIGKLRVLERNDDHLSINVCSGFDVSHENRVFGRIIRVERDLD